MPFTIEPSFIWNFKIGDNINYNLGVLSELYKCCETDGVNSVKLRKPIFITVMAIIEAVLYDFDRRIREHNAERIQNLSAESIRIIRSKKYDKLDKYIEHAKIHGFFDDVQENFYDDLHKLRIIRNRVHIQNDKNYTPSDEDRVFTMNTLCLAECALEIILRTMRKKYARSTTGCNDFNIPWSARYSEIDG